jgi:hypothetical protein
VQPYSLHQNQFHHAPSRPFIFCHASALPEREFGFYFSKPRSALQPLLAQMERLTWGGVGST